MKTKPAYLVIRQDSRGNAVVNRVRGTWPALEPGEAIVRVSLDLPDDFLRNPVHVLEIPAETITVAVETHEPEPEEDP